MSIDVDPRNDTDSSSSRDEQDRISTAVEKIIESRTVIDQAKGMLMFVYGIEADQAFELIRWQSQQNNTKVGVIAERVLRDFIQAARDDPPNRSMYDNLLLDAHRVRGEQ